MIHQPLLEAFPTVDDLQAAPLMVVAGVILREVVRRIDAERRPLSPFGVLMQARNTYQQSPEAAAIVAEAWDWLHAHGYICQSPDGDQHGQWQTVTRAGRAAAAAKDFGTWVAEREFPDTLVHPRLRGQCMNLFRQAEFGLAVGAAYLELEVAVRTACTFGPDAHGVPMMAKAFNPSGGKLADSAAPRGEQEALMHMFTGAFGSYRNPVSHRHVALDAAEAREMIIIASHLLKIVDSRRQP